MKKRYCLAKKALYLAVVCTSGTGYAASMNTQQLHAMMEQIVAQQTKGLQNEVKQLRKQVVSLRSKLAQVQYGTKSQVAAGQKISKSSTKLTGTEVEDSRRQPLYTIQPTSAGSVTKNDILTGIYFGGTPVVTSPYLGEHSAYDGSDLIVNQSTINFDVQLLKQQQAMEKALKEKGLPIPNHPLVELSGEVEGIANTRQTKPGNTRADINLSAAELDVYAQVTPWTFAFMEFQWNDSFPGVYRVANSNSIVNKAFVTVGNLNLTPWYASLGQLYVPFGRYSSYMVSDPLTKLMARTKARAFVLGYRPQSGTGVYASSYVFRSDTRESAKSADGGVNLGYEFSRGNVRGNFAVGAIANVADAQGMQGTPAPSSIPFSGFGTSSTTEQIFKPVPAINLHGSLSIGNYTFLAEYVASTTAFDPRAMTFNGHAARVSSGHAEAAYNFELHGRPGSFAIGYGFTKEALALFLPRDRYMTTLNYSFWKDTLASLEFRHDVNYASSNTASGAMSPRFSALHKYVNLGTFQFAVFF